MQSVFKAGFEHISERYIETTDLAVLSIAGMAKMSDIDPVIEARLDGNQVGLSASGSLIVSIPAPDTDDAEEWAKVTARLITLGQNHSALLGKTRSDKIITLVFDGMMKQLDSYSRYSPAEQARKNRALRQGFGGIGVQILVREGQVRVINTTPGGPAERSGIRPDDRITHVDGHFLKGDNSSGAVQRLRGRIGSLVNITIARDGAPLDVRIKRQLIVSDTVFPEIKGMIGYIRISSFNKRTAASLRRSLRDWKSKFQDKQITGLILDLRSNAGGLLKQAVQVADAFLAGGAIVTTEGRHPDSFQNFEADMVDLAAGLPLAVLINGNSASASEVTAAALQDQGRAVVIGSNSYGKGTVQNVIDLPNKAELTITWSRLHAPSGYTLDNLGILPTVCLAGLDPLIKYGLINNGQAGSDYSAILHTNLSQWRRISNPRSAEVDSLRNVCPSGRKMHEADIETAIEILKQPGLYARALITPYSSLAEKTEDISQP